MNFFRKGARAVPGWHCSTLAVLVVASLALEGCALLPAKMRPKPRPPKVAKGAAKIVPRPVAVGKVTLVNEDGKYALIDNGNFPAPPTGGVLRTYAGESQTAELLTTDVRRRPFVIADIKSGEPHKGDRVDFIPAELLAAKAGAGGAKKGEETKPAGGNGGGASGTGSGTGGGANAEKANVQAPAQAEAQEQELVKQLGQEKIRR